MFDHIAPGIHNLHNPLFPSLCLPLFPYFPGRLGILLCDCWIALRSGRIRSFGKARTRDDKYDVGNVLLEVPGREGVIVALEEDDAIEAECPWDG